LYRSVLDLNETKGPSDLHEEGPSKLEACFQSRLLFHILVPHEERDMKLLQMVLDEVQQLEPNRLLPFVRMLLMDLDDPRRTLLSSDRYVFSRRLFLGCFAVCESQTSQYSN